MHNTAKYRRPTWSPAPGTTWGSSPPRTVSPQVGHQVDHLGLQVGHQTVTGRVPDEVFFHPVTWFVFLMLLLFLALGHADKHQTGRGPDRDSPKTPLMWGDGTISPGDQ